MDPKTALPKRIQGFSDNVGSVEFTTAEITPVCMDLLCVISSVNLGGKSADGGVWGEVSGWRGMGGKSADGGVCCMLGGPPSELRASLESVSRGSA